MKTPPTGSITTMTQLDAERNPMVQCLLNVVRTLHQLQEVTHQLARADFATLASEEYEAIKAASSVEHLVAIIRELYL
eukprot:1307914-Prorocentrum_lima.AAC.1